ncbi:MAG: hypothetical protein FWG82_00805 [Oscillospiraceae bacterium]|nr:hypothetical protein [Oscillospiraceae bacterium]
MKTRKMSRKASVVIALLLAVVIAASATWAWNTSKQNLINPVDNKGYDVSDGISVIEKFNPPDDEDGGFTYNTTVEKEVGVLNAANGAVFVRVTFEEYLNLTAPGTPDPTKATIWAPVDAPPTPAGDYVESRTKIDIYDSTWTAVALSDFELENCVASDFAGMTIYRKNGTDLFRAFKTVNPGTDQFYQASRISVAITKDADGDDLELTLTGKPDLGWMKWKARDAAESAWNNTLFKSWNGKNNVDAANPGRNVVTGELEDWSDLYTATGTAPFNADFTKSYIAPDDITFRYGPAVSATITADEWFYNSADGYFYYIGVLAGGASTPQLFSAYHLEANARVALFDKNEYALAVSAEAIQATAEALSDAAGWNLSEGALLTALLAAL